MDGDEPAVSLPSYPSLPPSLGSSEAAASSSSIIEHFDPYSASAVDAVMIALDATMNVEQSPRPPLTAQSSDDGPPLVPPRSPLSQPPPPPPGSPPSPHTATPSPIPQTNPVQLPQGPSSPPQAATLLLGETQSSSLETGSLSLRLQYAEHLCGNLQREKKQLEESFGRQRKQFMTSMMQHDAELQLSKHSVEQFSKQIEELSRELNEKNVELKNIEVATRLSSNTTREQFDADRVKYEEEIASLRQIMQVKQKDVNEAVIQEREAWGREKQRLVGELQYLRNSFGRQSPYGGGQPQIPYGGQPQIPYGGQPQIPYGGQPQVYPRQQQQQPPHASTPPPQNSFQQPTSHREATSPSPSSSTPQGASPYQGSKLALNVPHPADTLETSMKKAEQDSELLRAIIVPYEEEIDIMKAQLHEANERIRELESKTSPEPVQSSAPSTPVSLIDLETSLPANPPQPATSVLDSPVAEVTVAQLQHQLNCEQAARHDLEMHTRSLETQKAALKGQVESLKEQLERVHTEFEKGKLDYTSLKKTWDLANQHFIVAQDQLKNQVYHLQQKVARYSNDSPEPIGGSEGQEAGSIEQKSKTLPPQRLLSLSSSGATSPVMPRSASWSSISNAVLVKESGEESAVSKVENELAKVREELARRTARCDSYENQLQRVQEQMVEEMDDKERSMDRLRAENAKVKAAVMRERTLRQELSRNFENTREEMQTRIETFRTAEKELTQQLKNLKIVFPKLKQNVQKEVSRFAEERSTVYKQSETYREEYECLKVVQVSEMNEYRTKLAENEEKQHEAECNLQTAMQQLEAMREETRRTNDSFSDELVQIKEELITVTREKEMILKTSSDQNTELQATRREIAELKLLHQKEQQAKAEALTTKQSIEEKSKSFIAQQQEQLEKLGKAKSVAEDQARDLQRQISSLKLQLNTTEANQEDFVRLSQSLQVRLAEMEEAEMKRSSREPTPTPSNEPV